MTYWRTPLVFGGTADPNSTDAAMLDRTPGEPPAVRAKPCGMRKPCLRGADLQFLALGYTALRYSLIRPSTARRRLGWT
jgi:hypothetical protein